MRDRSRVSTRLYWAALTDAITHQETALASHDHGWVAAGRLVSCCTPEARCGAYETRERQLRRYRAAKAALSRRPR